MRLVKTALTSRALAIEVAAPGSMLFLDKLQTKSKHNGQGWFRDPKRKQVLAFTHAISATMAEEKKKSTEASKHVIGDGECWQLKDQGQTERGLEMPS